MTRSQFKQGNRPYEYVVFGYRGKVLARRIPRGKKYRDVDVRDFFPLTQQALAEGRLAVVSAYSAATAKEYAAMYRGIK